MQNIEDLGKTIAHYIDKKLLETEVKIKQYIDLKCVELFNQLQEKKFVNSKIKKVSTVVNISKTPPVTDGKKTKSFSYKSKQVLMKLSFEDIRSEIESVLNYVTQVSKIYSKLAIYTKQLVGIYIQKVDRFEQILQILTHVRNVYDNATSNYSKSKKRNMYLKLFGSVNYRILYLPGYTNNQIESHDLKLFSKAMQNWTLQPLILNNFFNYSIALFRMDELLNIYFRRQKRFFKYKEYVVEKVSETMCKSIDINEFMHTLSSNQSFLRYMIDLFRKLYVDYFSDNIFRNDFKESSPILEFDGDMILRNIVMVTHMKKMKKEISVHFKGLPNLEKDYKIQIRNTKNKMYEKNNACVYIQQCFDDISKENATFIQMSYL